MKGRVRVFPGIKRRLSGSIKFICKRGLLIFLLLLMALGPVFSAAAGGRQAGRTAEGGGLFTTMGAVLGPVKIYAAGDDLEVLAEMPEDKLLSGLAALNEFNMSVLKDERLAGILDDIIWDLISDERFAAGIENKQEFAAEIIRDERLVAILGGVIADYLQDEQLAADIEFLFGVIFDLLADESLHYLIRDALAAVFENPKMEHTINSVTNAFVEIAYQSSIEGLSDLMSDQRIPLTINEVVATLVETIPDTVAGPLESEEVEKLASEMVTVVMEYGTDTAVNLLDDDRFREALADMLVLSLAGVPDVAAGVSADLTEHVGATIGEGLASGVLDQVVGNLVDEIFAAGLRTYFINSLNYVMSQGSSRAESNTPPEEMAGCSLGNNIRKQIAEQLAEIPPELIRDGFFNWLVTGVPNQDFRTYKAWALDMTGLLSEELVLDFSAELSELIRDNVEDFFLVHQDDLNSLLRKAVYELPWDDIMQDIEDREDVIIEASQEMVQRIIALLPLADLADHIRDELDSAELDQIVREIVDEIPFAEAGALLREDDRILEVMQDSIPGFSMKEIASLIRNDQRIVGAIADSVADFPVQGITEFIQDETRANLLGHTIAGCLLNLAADFVEDEGLTDFIHDTMINVVGSLDESPGTLVLDILAAFLENDQFAQYVVTTAHDLTDGVNRELVELYKQAVPRFFTHFIWRYL